MQTNNTPEEVKIIKLFGVEMAPNKKGEMMMKPPKEEEAKRRERRRSAIKKTRTSSPPLPPAPLPLPLLQTIRDMDGKDQAFVTRKILERSDTDASQNRFFIPKNEVLWGVLSEEERRQVEGGGAVEVMVLDPRGGKHGMKLKKWISLNKIVLNSGWRKLVAGNDLKAELDCVELWSFRADSKLCFALNVKRQV